VEVDEEDMYGDSPTTFEPVYPGLAYKTYDSIEALATAIKQGKVSRILYAGYDVGRYENASELMIIEELRDHNDFQMVRHTSGGRGMEFDAQQNMLEKTMSMLPIRTLAIDSTGIGKQLGEYMKKRFRSRVECIDFNIGNKQDMAVEFKIRLEEQLIGYPFDKTLVKHIHSIKREISTANQVRFVAEEIGGDHGDKFWALAMASKCGSPIRLLRSKFRAQSSAVPKTSNVIPIDSKRKFPKNKDEYVLPKGVEKPPLHSGMMVVGGAI
jgi:phage FluMu gp28-like protein